MPRGRRHDSIQNPGPDGAAGTARPHLIAPVQGEGWMFLIKLKRKVPRERKAKEGGERRRDYPGQKDGILKSFGRQRERLPAAHRRAGIGLEGAGQGLRFYSGF